MISSNPQAGVGTRIWTTYTGNVNYPLLSILYTAVSFELFKILTQFFCTSCANKCSIRFSYRKYHVTSSTFMTPLFLSNNWHNLDLAALYSPAVHPANVPPCVYYPRLLSKTEVQITFLYRSIVEMALPIEPFCSYPRATRHIHIKLCTSIRTLTLTLTLSFRDRDMTANRFKPLYYTVA